MIAPLTTVDRLLLALNGQITPSQSASLPRLVQAGSLIAERYMNRHILAKDYVEFRNVGLDNTLLLNQFPVNSIGRIATGLTTALTITNGNTTYQRASVSLDTSGTEYDGFTINGLKLNWVASGVPGSVVIPLSSNLTLGNLATSITGQGNGWMATPASSLANWASADIYPVMGAMSAIGSGCVIRLHTNELSNYILDPDTGEIQTNSWAGNSWSSYSTYPWDNGYTTPSFRNIRIEYNAGFATVPDDIQEAVIIIAQMLFEIHDNSLTTSKIKIFDYEEETTKSMDSIPESARNILNLYRSFRASGD